MCFSFFSVDIQNSKRFRAHPKAVAYLHQDGHIKAVAVGVCIFDSCCCFLVARLVSRSGRNWLCAGLLFVCSILDQGRHVCFVLDLDYHDLFVICLCGLLGRTLSVHLSPRSCL